MQPSWRVQRPHQETFTQSIASRLRLTLQTRGSDSRTRMAQTSGLGSSVSGVSASGLGASGESIAIYDDDPSDEEFPTIEAAYGSVLWSRVLRSSM